jgi:hypothetical protein
MNKYIILLNDAGFIMINEIVEELKSNGCTMTGIHANIGVISVDSNKTLEEVKALQILGVEDVTPDQPASLF